MKFYTAGKVWNADKFRFLRDTLGMPVLARWIDYDANHPIVQQKAELWKHCYEDVRDSDFVLLYSEDWDEEQRGALVEVGMAFGMGKPVYAVGRCKSIAPNEISDVAFTHYANWTWINANNLVVGAELAMEEYTKSRIILRSANLQ